MINLGNIKISDLRLGASQVKAMYFGSEQVWSGKEPTPALTPLCFTAEEAGSTVKLHKSGSAPAVNLQTSTDGSYWTPYTVEDTITLANVNDKVYFKAVGSNTKIGNNAFGYNKFVMTGKIAASGNVNQLLEEDEDTARTISLEGKNYCYTNMFDNCTSLTQAPTLPATTLAERCYENMFYGCTALTQAPELPATTLANNCYNQMFQQCTSLTTAPTLPATTLANNCYNYMFSYCTSLTQAPELPATTLVAACYSNMFKDCTALTTAPVLPATTLANNCYNSMFSDCTSLTSTPELPATTLAIGCYANMFYNCTSLTQAPELPATTLADGCYKYMFRYCTSLTTAPELPATTLADYCYQSMFRDCTSLTSVPELPASTLAQYCYSNMFDKCTSLTTAPAILPATTLADNCYYYMFANCSSLTTAPKLPTTTLANNCYASMFQGCSNLASINVSFTAWEPTNATTRWLNNVAATGTFECLQALIDNTTTRDSNTVPESWTMVAYDVEPVQCDALCFTAQEAGSTVKLHKKGSYPVVNLQTSTDGKQWTPYTVEDVITLANVGDKVYFKAVGSNNATGEDTQSYNNFVMTGKIAASGNVNSLLEEDEETARTMSLAGKNYCYYNMFNDCTSLTQAPELPATTLANQCYFWMFSGCSSLTTAPALPATTLANNCYSSMFQECTSLTQAPELPATTLGYSCYSNMFNGCTSLSSLKVAFTAWGNQTRNWLDKVAATGTFTCPAALPDTRGVNNIPAGWTKVDAA